MIMLLLQRRLLLRERAEREVAESVAAATKREAIRDRLLQYYEMYDVDFDPVTIIRTYFNQFPGKDQTIYQGLLFLHAMGMQASIHIYFTLLDGCISRFC